MLQCLGEGVGKRRVFVAGLQNDCYSRLQSFLSPSNIPSSSWARAREPRKKTIEIDGTMLGRRARENQDFDTNIVPRLFHAPRATGKCDASVETLAKFDRLAAGAGRKAAAGQRRVRDCY